MLVYEGTMTPELFTLLCGGVSTEKVSDTEIVLTEGTLTLAEILEGVLAAGARLGLRNGQPTLAGKVGPFVMAGLTKYRTEIAEYLQSGQGAKLEGLVCRMCEPEPEGTPTMYRFCSEHGNAPHWRKP